MQEFLAWWATLDATTQSGLATLVGSVLAGAIAWAVQKGWTMAKWLPGNAQTATGTQLACSFILPVLTALVASKGDWTKALLPLVLTWTTSQAIHLRTKAPCPTVESDAEELRIANGGD